MEANKLDDLALVVYAEKIWHALGMPGKCRKMPKMIFLAIFSKNNYPIVLIFCIVMDINEIYNLA